MTAKRLVLALVLLAFIGSTSGCYGPFNATRRLHQWNGEVSGPWTNELVFIGLMVVPAYALFTLGDALIFNSVEFWTGSNWIDPPQDSGSAARSHDRDPYGGDRYTSNVRGPDGGQTAYRGQASNGNQVDDYGRQDSHRRDRRFDKYGGEDPTGRNSPRKQKKYRRDRSTDPDLLDEEDLYTDTGLYDDPGREYRGRSGRRTPEYRNMSMQRIAATPRAFSEGDLILKLYRDLVPAGQRITVQLYDQGVLRENFTLVVESDGTVIKRDNNGNVLVYAQIRPDRSVWINDIEHNTSKLYTAEEVQTRVRRGTRRI